MATLRKKTAPRKQTPQQLYIQIQQDMVKLMDLKIGYTVRVLRNTTDQEFGSASHETYNEGAVLVVEDIDKAGIILTDGYVYPIFALELLKKSFVKINDEYDAEIRDDGSINVGCIHISYKLLQEIASAATDKLL